MSNKTKSKSSDALSVLKKRYYSDTKADKLELETERLKLDLANKIYILRSRSGLSQRDLAKLVGTSAAAICRLEDSDYEGHSLRILRKIALALNARIEIKFVPLRT